MSSHREAPEISKDPVADSTDLYAFVTPDRPGTVTLVANYVPLEAPAGGPNFYEFGDDVLYEIHIANRGHARPDISYRFRFTTEVRNDETFLYNTGPITSLDSPTFNRRQFVTVSRLDRRGEDDDEHAGGHEHVLGEHLACPPCNIGPRSTPDYDRLARAAVHHLDDNVTVFAGQRADPFFVDLGAVFDLLDLRPFQNLHLIPTPATGGVNTLATANVHTIALRVPIRELTRDGRRPTDPLDPAAVIGVWTSASRRRSRVYEHHDHGESHQHGGWHQVSRLGNPLVNEVVIPMGDKDEWNHRKPSGDGKFNHYVEHPEVARLLPVLYPGVFPHLAGLHASRADLVAILHTGIPAGLIPGFQNFTGDRKADLLRLNTAIPPTGAPKPFGLLDGDLAGYPNGRRLGDDVVTIELRAIAGVTYPLVAPSYVPDAAAGLITDGVSAPPFLDHFPYVDTPHDGFHTPSP